MSNPQIQSAYIGVRTANGYAPIKGPRVVALQFDFSIMATYNVHFNIVEMLDKLEFIQGVFCDNTLNPNAVTVLNRRTQQLVTFPPYSFGYLSIYAPDDAEMEITCVNPAIIVNLIFGNFPVANFIQETGAPGDAGSLTVTNAGSTGIDYSSNKPAIYANLLTTIPVNLARNSVEVQNQSAENVQVVMDDGAGNNISILILNANGANTGGGSWLSTTFKGRVRVYGASAGDQIYAHQN